MFGQIGFDPATANHENPQFRLGALYAHEANIYKYVQFKDAVTYAAGHVCIWANATGTAVTNDKSGGSGILDTTPVAGIAMGVMTQNYYGFICVAGVCEVQTDDGVVAGDFLVSHTVDGECDTMADGEEEQVFGIALEADTGDQVTAVLKGLL